MFSPLLGALRVARTGPGRRRGSPGGRPPGFYPARYARRNGIERGFCQLKHWRALATRYNEHARLLHRRDHPRRTPDLAPMIRQTLPSRTGW
jgi:transposase